MSLWTITGCVDDIKQRIVIIDKLLMVADESDIEWDKIKTHAEQIQEMSETLIDELYEVEEC